MKNKPDFKLKKNILICASALLTAGLNSTALADTFENDVANYVITVDSDNSGTGNFVVRDFDTSSSSRKNIITGTVETIQIGVANTTVNNISGKTTNIEATNNSIKSQTDTVIQVDSNDSLAAGHFIVKDYNTNLATPATEEIINASAEAITIGTTGTVNNINGATNAITSSTSNNMSTTTGGSVQTNTTSAFMQGTGTIASNGTTGIISGTTGKIATYNTAQTIAPGSTIGGLLDNKTYHNKINGNTYIDGNLYINGTLDYVSSSAATTTVTSTTTSTSKLTGATQGTMGKSEIINKGTVRSDGSIATESSASLTLENGYGNTHGIEIYEDRTKVTGGTQSTTMVLDDDGVTFSESTTGAPVKVTGVADGTSTYDAVNYGQLQQVENRIDDVAERAYSGIAQIAAIAAIPGPVPGKNYSLGVGTGYYAGQHAIAFGAKANIGSNVQVGASISTGFSSSSSTAASAGASFSW